MKKVDTFVGPSFSFRNRCLRLLWGVFCSLFFRYSPRVFHGWRVFLLRCFGAKVGVGVHVYPKVVIWAPWNITLGDQCGVADNVTLYSQDCIRIGKRAVVSQGSYLCTGTHDYSDRKMPLITAPISIGDESWIAAECFIMPGVDIGARSVVGVRSLVTKNMPSDSICVGHPCIPVRTRIIKDL